MRVGDFSVELVPSGEGRLREMDSGHVLARPGQVYRLRLRNHGPLRAVADIDVDGKPITAGGLVLRPWSVTELERPIRDGEHGRFTVVAEGNEAVFGSDGGRDNQSLGLIEGRFRRELPRPIYEREPFDGLILTETPVRPLPGSERPRRPSRLPSEWSPPMNSAGVGSPMRPLDRVPSRRQGIVEESIESAAGTGLTGHSEQEFVPIHLGPLEDEATVIRLRIVIGSEEAIANEAVRPLHEQHVPDRPAARP